MRKVKISKYIPSEYIEGTQEIKPGTGCKLAFKYEGYFHRWVNSPGDLFGIIENMDGTIFKVHYSDIKFEPINRVREKPIVPTNAGGFPADVSPFEQVKLGMVAFHCSSEDPTEKEGTVIWKGKWSEWIKEFPDRKDEWEGAEEMTVEDMDYNYDLVLIDTIQDGEILFNYDNDPSGVYCKK